MKRTSGHAVSLRRARRQRDSHATERGRPLRIARDDNRRRDGYEPPLPGTGIVKQFRAAVDATVAVEFALIGSFLALLITGTADYSRAIWQQIMVRDAARAGAAYASIHGFNTTNIQTAATSATNASITVSTPVQSCGCARTSGITSATCGTQCAGLGNAAAGTYVTVTVTSSYTPLVPFPGLSAMTLSATAIARIN